MAAKESVPGAPAVFAAMAAVRSEINKIGLAKDREVKDGVRFRFRGIDDVLNTFSGPMAAAGLMIIPSYSELQVIERPTKNGRTYNSVVKGHYMLVSTVDGSVFQMGSFYGEANDTQDKSIAKAQSIALRQAYLQTFVVPLGAEMDPEMTEHDDAPDGEREPESKGAAARSEAKTGPVADPLTAAQARILKQKLKNAGISDDVLAEAFGQVDSSNYNSVMDWIKKNA